MCALCATISYTTMAKLRQLLLAHSKRCWHSIFITSSSTLFIAYNAREEHLIHLARAKGVGADFVSYAQP